MKFYHLFVICQFMIKCIGKMYLHQTVNHCLIVYTFNASPWLALVRYFWSQNSINVHKTARTYMKTYVSPSPCQNTHTHAHKRVKNKKKTAAWKEEETQFCVAENTMCWIIYFKRNSLTMTYTLLFRGNDLNECLVS